MSEIIIDITQPHTATHQLPQTPPVPQARASASPWRRSLWEWFALAAIALLSGWMEFFQLGTQGHGNLYYASGVRSMLDSWHNFFFVSLDPGGFVSVDKPPVGFWLQTWSARLFGFTSFSLYFPQALCGLLAVLLLNFLVRRHFGPVAGLFAALALAITPISVATTRNNTIDGTLALCLLLAAWAMLHAAETGRLCWLLSSFSLIGLGFNIKMAAAYLLVPALIVTYLLCAPRKFWVRCLHLLPALVLMVALSLSWVLAVDATPASARPYVGSTKDNSAVSLAFGYNGLARLHLPWLNRNQTPTKQKSQAMPSSLASNLQSLAAFFLASSERPKQADQSAVGSSAVSKTINPLNLLSLSDGGQVGWLLPLALLGLLSVLWQGRPRFRQERKLLGLVLWGMWLLTMGTFFTLNNAYHQYYLVIFSPGVCACAALGLARMWEDYRRGNWRGWLLPLALVITAATQIAMLASYPAWARWLSPLIASVCALVALALVVGHLVCCGPLSAHLRRLLISSVTLALAALLLAPLIWSGYTVVQNLESGTPVAGPDTVPNPHDVSLWSALGLHPTSTVQDQVVRTRLEQAGPPNNLDPTGWNLSVDRKLLSYLEAHQGQTKFLMAVTDSGAAEPYILDTNLPVMDLGGFGGGDSILTVATLKDQIRQNMVHYFLFSTTNGKNVANYGGQRALVVWIKANCTSITPHQWGGTIAVSGLTPHNLYYCSYQDAG